METGIVAYYSRPYRCGVFLQQAIEEERTDGTALLFMVPGPECLAL